MKDDTISRQAAIDALRTHERKASHKWFDNQLDIEWNNAIDICCYDIEDLPSAQPERKRGKWINGTCNQCGSHAPYWAMATTYYRSNFCPSCGAYMRGEQDE